MRGHLALERKMRDGAQLLRRGGEVASLDQHVGKQLPADHRFRAQEGRAKRGNRSLEVLAPLAQVAAETGETPLDALLDRIIGSGHAGQFGDRLSFRQRSWRSSSSSSKR